MATLELSEAHVFSITGGSDLDISQLHALVVYNTPSEGLDVSNLHVQTLVGSASGLLDVSQLHVQTLVGSASGLIDVSQLHVLVLIKNRIDDPIIRAWTYSLDNHDYYVLKLGDVETLVYDTYSEQWMTWGHFQGLLWKVNCGINWNGSGRLSYDYGSNVVVGDYDQGVLYFLDPTYPFDDNWSTGEEDRLLFECQATGEITLRGPDSVPCNVVQLTGSVGNVYDVALRDVTLTYSDDAGRNFVDAGTLSITPQDYDARVEWRSLGSMRSPGRVFRITDSGSVTRIDGLDLINDGQ